MAEDKPLMRGTLIAFLKNYPSFEIVGEASNGRELLDLFKLIQVDIVILDLEMPVMGGLEVLKIMQLRFQHIKTIILSLHKDLAHVSECLLLGAGSYLSKDCIPEQLIDTITNVYTKGFYVEENTYQNLLQNLVRKNSDTKQKLSKREMEIVKELYNGKTEKEISGILNISRGTVHFHRMNIYSKTDTHNLAGLLKYVSENSLV